MITENNRIKCDMCGKFIKEPFCGEHIVTKFTPDTPFSYESIEHYHRECYKEVYGETKK